MTSSYYSDLGRGIDAPISGEGLEIMRNPAMSEEVDLTESVNAEVDRLADDKDRYFNQLIAQYNHMYEQPTKAEELLSLLQKGVQTKNKWDEYQKEIQPFRDFQNRIKEAKLFAHPENRETYRWVKGKDPKTLERIINGEAILADDDAVKDIIHEQKSNAHLEETNAAAAELRRNGDFATADEIDQVGVYKDSQGRGFIESQREYYRSVSTLKEDFPQYWGIAAHTLEVIVGTDDEGNPIFKTFNNARHPGEARAIGDAILLHYLWGHQDLIRGRMGRFKRHFAMPINDQLDGLMADKLKSLGQISEKVAKENRAQDIKDRLQVNPNYLIDHINLNVGAYDGSYKEAKLQTALDVARYASTGVFDRATVEKALNTPFEAHDGSIQTIDKYWKKEAGIMMAAVGKYETEQANLIEARHQGAIDADASRILEELRGRKTPPTMDEVKEIQANFLSRHQLRVEQLPEELKSIYTKGTVADFELDWELGKRVANGETITATDLDGIESAELKAKWTKALGIGVDKDGRDGFIKAAVNQKTQELDLNTAKTIKWRAYESNATSAFNNAYNQAIKTGTHEEAMAAGRAAVLEGLKLESDNDTPWARYGADVQPTNVKQDMAQAKVNLGKDPSLINSDQLMIGEKIAIKESIDYINGKKSNLPVYYRNLQGNIKRLPDGSAGTGRRIMRWRLLQLGIIKESDFNKPRLRIPEDKLPPEYQQLLRKPSPSKTYRVTSDVDTHGIKLIDPARFSSYDKDVDVEEEGLRELRSKAQVSQQYALIDSSYRTLVNIPKELNDEFTAQVGELPPFLHLDNLQPEVAKAFVADVLMA